MFLLPCLGYSVPHAPMKKQYSADLLFGFVVNMAKFRMSPESGHLSVCVPMCANCEGGSLMAGADASKLFTNILTPGHLARHHIPRLSLQLILVLGLSSGQWKWKKCVSCRGLAHKNIPQESPFSFSFPVYLLHTELRETLKDCLKVSLPSSSIFPSHQPASDSETLIFYCIEPLVW